MAERAAWLKQSAKPRDFEAGSASGRSQPARQGAAKAGRDGLTLEGGSGKSLGPMKTPSISTEAARAARTCLLVDADGQVLGRLASQVAALLRGKHLPFFTPHVDGGSLVVVINAARIRLTGKKRAQKVYYRHSGWVGGLTSTTADELLSRRPEQVIELAVRGMLPKTIIGRQMGKRLLVYPDAGHPHQAQTPTVYTLRS